jgi:hypothetical protein
VSSIYDTIVWLKSKATEKHFPVVLFSGDTDMVTDGWLSLTSSELPEIVVTQATADEYRAISKGDDAYLNVEDRVNAALRRIDLRCSWLVGVEKVAITGQGMSFEGFRKSYQPAKLIFKDIFVLDSLAYETSRTTRFEFESNGGKVVVLE